MQKHILPLLCAGVIASPIAAAESELYVTGGVSSFDPGSNSSDGATIRAGWRWDEHFGAEIEGSLGEKTDTPDNFREVGIDSQVGVFLVGRAPLGENASVFARIGYTRTEVEYEYYGNKFLSRSDTPAFGFGGEYMFNERLGVRGDYTYFDHDDSPSAGPVNALSVSAVFKFGGPE